MCVIVGDIPNSGYMFTQEHACLRISTKPVDVPEDSPQTPQHPPKVTHRSERTWGNLIKTKGQTKYLRQNNTRRPHHYFTIAKYKNINILKSMQQKTARSLNLTIAVFPPQHKFMYSPTAQNAPVHTKQIQRPDQNLRQKQAVYNRKMSEYTDVA